MKCARESRYWRSYRDSKTFTLTIYIYEAHLGFSNGSGIAAGSTFHSSSFHNSSFSNLHGGGSVDTSLSSTSTGHGAGGPWDTKIVVSLPKDPMGERHETSRAGKTPNPVWDQAVVFRDIDYSELVRVEMRGIRKLGDNPVLASVEFEVHDVMGLSLRDGASVFQLECDRSRARYGVILLAFRFDPPVAADVLGEFDGIGSEMVPRELSAVPSEGEEEDSITPAWGRREPSHQPEVEPVYINVDGHFACLLLDDDTLSYPCKSSRPSTASSSSVLTRDKDTAASPGRSRAGIPGGGQHTQHFHHQHQHPRLSVGSTNSTKSENSVFDRESLIHGRGSAVRLAAMAEQLSAGNGGGGGGGSGGSSYGAPGGGKRFSSRPRSLGNSLAQQLSALGIGVGSGAGSGAGGGGAGAPKAGGGNNGNSNVHRRGKPAPVVDPRRGSSGANTVDDAARFEAPHHRWSIPRRRLKHQEQHAPAAGGTAQTSGGTTDADGRSHRGGGKRSRTRAGFASGFPILSSLRARASGGAARARSKSTSAAAPYTADSGDSSCASTVQVGEEGLMFEAAPAAEPGGGGGTARPSLAVSAVCDVPVSLELSPTGFKVPRPLLGRSLSEELASAKE
eukprot:g6966.t1